ncbi:hypothetical protein [Rhodoligotrophos defluvii]|uniref:hypothetical protein n=1 Tax=Rhodoligotrophos defluvii TaxID=2561934 RepID=UPI0010C9E149|nr:hypothetical protein [Rhodoligotrophos defluvii]
MMRTFEPLVDLCHVMPPVPDDETVRIAFLGAHSKHILYNITCRDGNHLVTRTRRRIETQHLRIENEPRQNIHVEAGPEMFKITIGTHGTLEIPYKDLDATDHIYEITQLRNGTVDIRFYEEHASHHNPLTLLPA